MMHINVYDALNFIAVLFLFGFNWHDHKRIKLLEKENRELKKDLHRRFYNDGK
jgi:hypothetical protein